MRGALKIVVAICALVLLNLAINYFGIADSSRVFLDEYGNYWVFILVMSAACPFGFPLSVCYIFAGLAFPVAEAWGACMAGLFMSSSIGYALGRFLLPASWTARLRARFFAGEKAHENLLSVNFYVRAIPGVPYWAQNVLLSSFATPYGMYAAVNMSVQGAIALAMVMFAASAKEPDAAKFAIFAVLVAAMFAIHAILKRLLLREQD